MKKILIILIILIILPSVIAADGDYGAGTYGDGDYNVGTITPVVTSVEPSTSGGGTISFNRPGQTLILNMKPNVNFPILINRQSHSIYVEQINESSGTVKLTFKSDPIVIFIKEGTIEKLDYDKDGIYDISFELIQIYSNTKAKIKFVNLDEPIESITSEVEDIPTEVINDPVIETEVEIINDTIIETEVDVSELYNNSYNDSVELNTSSEVSLEQEVRSWLKIIIISLVVILIISYLIYKYRKDKTFKKEN